MPVCRHTLAATLACDLLFVPGTWTVASGDIHARFTLSRGRVIFARGTGRVYSGKVVALSLRATRRAPAGAYTMTVSARARGRAVTWRRTILLR